MAYSLNIDTNANSGASGSITFGNKSYGGKTTTGIPPWAVVVMVAIAALVVLRRKGS